MHHTDHHCPKVRINTLSECPKKISKEIQTAQKISTRIGFLNSLPRKYAQNEGHCIDVRVPQTRRSQMWFKVGQPTRSRLHVEKTWWQLGCFWAGIKAWHSGDPLVVHLFPRNQIVLSKSSAVYAFFKKRWIRPASDRALRETPISCMSR